MHEGQKTLVLLLRRGGDARPLARRRDAGFTLIELIVVVTAIAILASIAVPSYSEYVRRSRRSDAQQFMQQIAARQQHFLFDRRAYSTSVTAAGGAGGLGMSIPANVAAFYAVTMTASNTAAAPPAFIVTGTPVGSQSGERCGVLTLDQNGIKAATGAANCW